MSGPKISDHALVRLLERAGGLDIEQLREEVSISLENAFSAARSISQSDFLIRVDGMVYVVRGSVVTTVLDDKEPRDQAFALRKRTPAR